MHRYDCELIVGHNVVKKMTLTANNRRHAHEKMEAKCRIKVTPLPQKASTDKLDKLLEKIFKTQNDEPNSRINEGNRIAEKAE